MMQMKASSDKATHVGPSLRDELPEYEKERFLANHLTGFQAHDMACSCSEPRLAQISSMLPPCQRHYYYCKGTVLPSASHSKTTIKREKNPIRPKCCNQRPFCFGVDTQSDFHNSLGSLKAMLGTSVLPYFRTSRIQVQEKEQEKEKEKSRVRDD